MALTTDISGASSDSYVSLAEYTAYAGNRGWTVRDTDAENEQDLRRSADLIDRGHAFSGAKTTYEQRRAWPRFTSIEVDGYLVPSDTIPQDIKDAQMELAYLIKGGLDPVATVDGLVASERSKAGPVEVETTYTGGKSTPRLVAIEGLLRPYTGGGSQAQVRLMRG